ncbi:hypothetical protein Tco_0438214 [Tanacetum coccineum]
MLKFRLGKGSSFGKTREIIPGLLDPFKVIKRGWRRAYKLELPEELSRVHNTFHVSNLKKCHADEPLAVPLDGLHFDDKLQFVEEPIEITDREVKRLKRSRIPLVKVRWNSKRGPEFTWEREDQFRKKYPHLFSKTGHSSKCCVLSLERRPAYPGDGTITPRVLGPLVWPSITEDGVTRLKEYVELTPAEAIQADCDIKAINIILQGLPTEIYALVSQHQQPAKGIRQPSQQATIYDGKVTVQPVQGRQTTYAAGTTRKFTPGASGSNTGKQRTVICYNCKGEGSYCQAMHKPRVKAKIAPLWPISQGMAQALTEGNCQNLTLLHNNIYNKKDYKDLKEKQNVENSFSGSNEQFAEIVHLKQNLFEQVQEKDCLMKTVSELKNKLKLEENRNIEREIDLEKKIKQLDNIIFKRGQSAQTVHMMTKSKICYDHSSKQAIGFEKPFCLKKARESMPKLYDGNTISRMDTIVVPDSDVNVVKERTTATAITEGTWGFEHTKACFRDEIIPFIKNLKDIFNNFNRYLVEELADVQKVFYQMEQAVEQHRLESRTFEVKMNQVLGENERLLEQAIDKDIVKTVVNLSVNANGENVTECQKCLELETELVKKKDFVDKETYDKLCKCFTNLEKHCITLEADSQLNQEIFQQENSVLNQNAPSFTQLFELSELKAQSQAKDTVIVKLKEQIKSLKGNGEDSSVKLDMDEIETLNIELEHRVTKLVTENEHLKQTYKQLYDSIKPKRVQSKEQCDALIKQVNIKSAEISDLNAKLQEQGLVIAALKNELRKLKGKALDNKETVTHSVDPNMDKDNMEPITPKLLNKRTAHSSYIKHTQEEALVLRDIVEHVKANYPQDPLLESAFRYTKVIQDLLSHISRSCPSINNCGPQLIEVIPRKKDKHQKDAHGQPEKVAAVDEIKNYLNCRYLTSCEAV